MSWLRLATFFCLSWTLLLTAQFSLDNVNFKNLRQVRADNAEVVFHLEADSSRRDFIAVLGWDGNSKTGCILRWNEKGLNLTKHEPGKKPQTLLQNNAPLPEQLSSQGGTITCRTRQEIVEVLANQTRYARGMALFSAKGQVAAPTDQAFLSISKADFQRLEPFQFGDDFMRTEEEAKQWGLWNPQAGEWKIYSVMERITANPDARIRDGREPLADRSPNPFCLSGKAPAGEGLISTGYDFWCDYQAAVSIKPFGAAFGLAFAVQDTKNFWMVRWQLNSLGTAMEPLQLIQKKQGQEKILAEVLMPGRLENWWRLAVRLRGDEISVLLDNEVIHTSRHPECPGGQIGLYVKGDQETYFDDVAVHTLTDLSNDPALLATTAVNLRGKWQVEGNTATAPKNGEDKLGALPMMQIGFEHWPAQRFAVAWQESHQDWHRKAKAGIAFAVQSQNDYWQAIWKAGAAPEPPKLELGQWRKGKFQVVTSLPWHVPPKKLAVDCQQKGVIQVWADKMLALRHIVPENVPLGGKVGLLGTENTKFTEISAFNELHRDWEKPVDIQRFADDPFMQGWASSRYAWLRDPGAPKDAYPQRHVFTGDVYGAFILEAPMQSGLNYHFGGDQVDPQNGYELQTEINEKDGTGKIILFRAGKMLAGANFAGTKKTTIAGSQIVDEKIGVRPRTPDTVSWGTLTLNKDGHAIWAALNGQELFSVLEEQPLTGRTLAVDIPAPLDFIHLNLRRESLRDYLFEQAETDWSSLGAWEVTNRFACDPRWSHMNGESRGVAALWSKFNLIGDYTIECFAGMRMRQGELKEDARISYPRVGDINVALHADGTELFSGYNMIIAAWDEQWSENWTQLWRGAEMIKQTDQELIPRGRRRSPGSRAITLDWDPGGRPVHGAWYALKIRRTGNKIDLSFDNIPVFSYEDPNPLPEGKIALWTQFNSIVLARVKVSYRGLQTGQAQATLAKATAPAATPINEAPLLKLSSHDSLSIDFASGLGEIAPWQGDQSAELSLVPGPDNSTVLQAVNCNSGGDFGVRLPMRDKRLERILSLSTEVNIPRDVKVNLYFTVKDDPQGRYFITLSGPSEEQPNLHSLGSFENFQVGRWSQVSFNLSRALRQRFPWRDSWVVDSMMIGMMHEGYLNAGLGGNHAGAMYQLGKFVALSIGPLQVTGTVNKAPGGDAPKQLRAWLGKSWRANPPAELQPTAGIAFSLPESKPGEAFLHLEALCDGRWQRLPATPLVLCAPPAEPNIDPAPGKTWGFNPVKIAFATNEFVRPLPGTVKLNIAGFDIPINQDTVTLDNDSRTMTIRPHAADLYQKDQESIEMILTWKDNLTGNAAKAQQKKWQCKPQIDADRTPPSAVVLEPARHSLRGLRSWDKEATLDAKSGAEMTLQKRDNQTLAAMINNRICGANSGLQFNIPPFTVAQFPVLQFDYKIPPQTYVDLTFASLGRQFTLGLTDCDHRAKLGLGDVPGIVADNTWRQATVPLAELFRAADGLNWDVKDARINSVAIGNWNYSGAAPGCDYEVSNLTLTALASTLEKPFQINWYAIDAGGIKGYSYVWDDKPETVPPKKILTTKNSLEVSNLPPGQQYFHIRACDLAGNWGPASHYPFEVDNRRPQPGKQYPPATTADKPTKANPEELTVTFNDSDGWINFDAAVLEINGKPFPLQRHVSDWNHKDATFTWDMLADWTLLRRQVDDQQKFTASLTGLKTTTGNTIPEVNWHWQIDYSLDKTPPGSPIISGGNNIFRRHETFSSGRLWASNSNITKIVKDELTGSDCLEITFDSQRERRFIVPSTTGHQINPENVPLLRFRYRLAPGSQVNLLANINNSWRSVTMTGPDGDNIIGTVPDIKDDDQWHWALVELAPLLANANEDSKKVNTIRSLAFGLLPAVSPATCQMRIDDFSLIGSYGPLPFFTFTGSDATGIAGYEARFSRKPDDEPSSDMPKSQDDVWLSAADQEGLWFVHVRARDGAGNRGEVVHAPYFCNTPAVQMPAGEGLEETNPKYPWRLLNAENKKQNRHPRQLLHKVKAGQNQLLAVQISQGQQPAADLVRKMPDVTKITKVTVDVMIQEEVPLKIQAICKKQQGDENIVTPEIKVNNTGQWQRNLVFTFPEPVTATTEDLIGLRIDTIQRKQMTVLFDNIRAE